MRAPASETRGRPAGLAAAAATAASAAAEGRPARGRRRAERRRVAQPLARRGGPLSHHGEGPLEPHDFRLSGRGLNRRTGRAFMGVATWNVKLVRGSYTYRSDVTRSKRRLRVG
jgi:hypothetical protein